MSVNSRFAVGIHILTMLAHQQPELLTSAYIAYSVTTNPVVIRRVLGDLRRAELVTSQAGSGGGWKLRRKPEQITLLDAYKAVKEGPLFAMHAQRPNPHCDIGKTIQQTLADFFTEAETALEAQLAQSTIADVLARMRAQACPPTASDRENRS